MGVAPTKYNQFAVDLSSGVHDLAADTMFVALSNSQPDAVADKSLADIVEIDAGTGYVAGGQLAPTLSVAAGPPFTLFLDKVVFTALGGPIGPFQFIVLYNATPAAQPLIGFYDAGSAIVLDDQDTFEVDFDLQNGAITVT